MRASRSARRLHVFETSSSADYRPHLSAKRDSIGITLDTSGEARYGYWFELNLGDSIGDGTLLPEQRFSSDWDGPWHGATTQTDSGWSAEVMIPWGTEGSFPLVANSPRSVFLNRVSFPFLEIS